MAKLESRDKLLDRGAHAIADTLQARVAAKDNRFHYDGCASGDSLYNYFRDYDPSLGRYVESDPIGLRGGFSTFGYVNGNPVRKVDLKGLFEFEPTCFGCKNDLEQWRNEMDNACKRAFAEIKDPKLRDCVMKRCEKGKVACDGPECGANRDWVGHNNRVGGAPEERIVLCASNQGNFTKDNRRIVGCTAVHEWAHSCGWDHGYGLNIPGNSGELDRIECATKWR
jgi:RHS repeat-associated protein